jgi:hypothetical protein
MEMIMKAVSKGQLFLLVKTGLDYVAPGKVPMLIKVASSINCLICKLLL